MAGSAASERNLVTGISGFAGPHLARLLINAGEQVVGYGPPLASAVRDGLESVTSFDGDIRDAERLAEVIAEVRPRRIYHLAALSHVGESWNRRTETLDVNVLGTSALLDAVARTEPGLRVLLASTGQVYGRVDEREMPVSEARPPWPTSPYAASKFCAEIVAQQATAAGQADVVVARPFNFAGPGQAPVFVCADFARQIARVEHGLAEPRIAVGNLEAQRDFTDVRDMVRGFDSIARSARPGEVFNLCSGRGVRIRDLLDSLLELAAVPIDVTVDRDRIRPLDVPLYVGDGRLVRDRLGWEAAIPLSRTLADTLEQWRGRTAAEARP